MIHVDDYDVSSGSFFNCLFSLQNYSQMELGILKLAAVLIIGEYNL